MRDLILLGALLSVLPLILRAPQIGILAWIWVTLMNPQREVYGFLSGFQLNFYIAIATAFAWAGSREKKIAPMNPVTAMLVLFAFWVSVTTYYALQRDVSYELWDRTIKTLVLAFAVLAIANNKARIQAVVWAVVLSIGYFGIKGGGFTLLTGGRNHVFGPENSMIADNNHLGLALVMILPLMNYLRVTSRRYWVRAGLLAVMGLTIVAVIGTYSRGALVALGVAGGVYMLKSRSGLLPLVLGGMVLLMLPNLVPASWFHRMSTIDSAGQDASFQERLEAWRTSFNVAEAHPLTGGGFASIENDWVAHAYHSPGSLNIGRAAHSIYFEVLGDHGFVGLALFLMLVAAAWYNTSATLSFAKTRPELDWAAKLARMLQVSIVAYMVGGAALSMAYYDGYLVLLALSGALLLAVKQPATDALGRTVPAWRRKAEQDMARLPEMPAAAMDLRAR
ncbi:MAG: putative O-glycosylation ligase, exosortase A system-associated [Alphaproteobacteria bacterium]|nr:putative O-glycosylation ligase, exosortase A system-associated [Alphaproteobacteria bacterium]